MEIFTIFVFRISIIVEMFHTLRRPLFQLATLFALCTLASCVNSSREYVSVEGQALGTFVAIKYDGEGKESDVVDMIKKIDQEAKSSMSIFDKNSLLSRINSGQTDSLDNHIAFNIALAERFHKLSNGAYDITIKPLTEAWGFADRKADGSVPNIDSLIEFVGHDKIAVVEGCLKREDPRTQIDLNSIAKGYTVDLMADELEAMGIANYMVNIGGEIRCRGLNSRGTPWAIGIETPYEGNYSSTSFEKIISKSDCAMATSGNYRRFYTTDDGRKVAHTLNPKTGHSVTSELLSATVIAPTCAEADAAATMFMALGSEGGAVELAKQCEEEYGWLYYFIFADGEGYRVEASDELKGEE